MHDYEDTLVTQQKIIVASIDKKASGFPTANLSNTDCVGGCCVCLHPNTGFKGAEFGEARGLELPAMTEDFHFDWGAVRRAVSDNRPMVQGKLSPGKPLAMRGQFHHA